MESGRQFGRQAVADLLLARNRCCRHTGRHTMPAQGLRACPCPARYPAPGETSASFSPAARTCTVSATDAAIKSAFRGSASEGCSAATVRVSSCAASAAWAAAYS